jgi:trk system potassium uptake protein
VQLSPVGLLRRIQAVNLNTVLSTIGKLLIGLSFAMLVPLIMVYVDSEIHWSPFPLSVLITAGFGLLLSRVFSTGDDIYHREGFAIVASVWVFFSFFGSLPYLLSEPSLGFVDAFFETMSGFTTTGSSILTDIESQPRSILLWRSITQWIGGMGIIVLGIAVLPALGIGGMQLYRAEVPGATKDKLTPRIKDTAKILWGTYGLLTLTCIIALLMAETDLFDAVCHALCAMSSGGFSTHNTSVAAYDKSIIHYILIVFMLLAGMNFANHYKFSKKQFSAFRKDEELKYYLLIVLGISLLMFLSLWNAGTYEDYGTALRDSLFTTVSLLTTTGFVTADFEAWPEFCRVLVLGLMFSGACAGSTAGGIKVIRLLILFKGLYQQIHQLLHPKAVRQVRISQQILSNHVILASLGFMVLYLSSFGLGTLIMTGTGLDLISAASATAACLGNIGPGLNLVGPTDNFAHITESGKLVLAFLMLLGRLELYTVIVVITPAFWKSR